MAELTMMTSGDKRGDWTTSHSNIKAVCHSDAVLSGRKWWSIDKMWRQGGIHKSSRIHTVYVKFCCNWQSLETLSHPTSQYWKRFVLLLSTTNNSTILYSGHETRMQRCRSCTSLNCVVVVVSPPLHARTAKLVPSSLEIHGNKWKCCNLPRSLEVFCITDQPPACSDLIYYMFCCFHSCQLLQPAWQPRQPKSINDCCHPPNEARVPYVTAFGWGAWINSDMTP